MLPLIKFRWTNHLKGVHGECSPVSFSYTKTSNFVSIPGKVNIHSYSVSIMDRDRTTVNPLLNPLGDLFISSPFEGEGGLIERRGLFNLQTTMVLVLHKELEYKVEKFLQLTIRIRTSTWWINHPRWVNTKFYSRDWSVHSIIYYWRIIRGGKGGLWSFFP